MTTSTPAFRKLDSRDRLPAGSLNTYYLEDLKRRVSVARIGGKLYAFDDHCPHGGCPLSSGLLTGATLMCPCDGSKFDLGTGRVVRGPAEQPLTMHQARERDGSIEVQV